MRRFARWAVLAAPLLLLLTLHVPEAEARPGGGSSYRGSSRSSSSSSSSRSSSSRSSSSSSSSSRSYSSSSSSGSYSSGGGSSSVGGSFCAFFTFVGFAVLLVVIVVNSQKAQARQGWSTSTPSPYTPPPRNTSASLRERLARLRTVGPRGPDGQVVPFDPDFSLVLFEDFLYSLYAHVHEARGGGRVDSVSAYVSDEARAALRALGTPAAVKAVVVGALHYEDVSPLTGSSRHIQVKVRFEANYTEVSANRSERSWYVAEEWTLGRGTQVRSRPPADVRVFKCPSCGAPLDAVQGNTCSYCQQRVDTGAFDWVVRAVAVVEREPRGPQLTGTTEEQGTDLPSVVDPKALSRFQALAERDPGLSLPTLQARINHIFLELQVAWSERRWERARPYVSDNLFQSQLYWMKAYREAGLRNVSEAARTTKLELVRVTSDRYFQAVTVRVFATGLDYTVRDSDGEVVGGSRKRPRAYSEYWTLIRGTGVKSRTRQERNCPSCGAPLEGYVNMAGHCTHCQARVASGEFDWVLSRIEQDESYQG